MKNYKIVEIFKSINGEGKKAGQLALFIRFQGCNLNCDYCDTKWANKEDVDYTLMNTEEIINKVIESGIKNITITGGEPLIQPYIIELLEELSKLDIEIEIETNGSVGIQPFTKFKNISLTMDYKLSASGMEELMCLNNFLYLRKNDTVKFVSGSIEDLKTAKAIIEKYNLINNCSIYISPVFKKIKPVEIVSFMLKNNLNKVNLQLQIHKIIWDPNKKGV